MVLQKEELSVDDLLADQFNTDAGVWSVRAVINGKSHLFTILEYNDRYVLLSATGGYALLGSEDTLEKIITVYNKVIARAKAEGIDVLQTRRKETAIH